MKLKGQRVEEKALKVCVFERPSGNLVFKLSAVLNTSDFEKIYPIPRPPEIIVKGAKVLNPQDKRYVEAVAQRNASYTDWIILNTLAATEDLEWETVNMGDPNTWRNWRSELVSAGFSDGEIMYLVNTAVEVNGLDEARLEAARKSFLLGQAMEMSSKSDSQNTEAPTT